MRHSITSNILFAVVETLKVSNNNIFTALVTLRIKIIDKLLLNNDNKDKLANTCNSP